MRCPRVRSCSKIFLITIRWFASRAHSLLKEITFHFILENVLSLCCRHVRTILWFVISDVECDNANERKHASIENAIAHQRISICCANREQCHRSECNKTSIKWRIPGRRHHHCRRALEWMFYFIWIGIMASRHTIKSCQFINSMPLPLSSTRLSLRSRTRSQQQQQHRKQNIKWNEVGIDSQPIGRTHVSESNGYCREHAQCAVCTRKKSCKRFVRET